MVRDSPVNSSLLVLGGWVWCCETQHVGGAWILGGSRPALGAALRAVVAGGAGGEAGICCL